MNKVITINLGGIAFQLEDTGYDALQAYLETAKSRLEGNPDRDEILSDIERAIADKFRGVLNAHKTVVLVKEVDDVLAQMGQIEDESGPKPASDDTRSGATDAGSTAKETGTAYRPKRLYCIKDGAMLMGVCNGIAAYFGIDPTFVRLGFVLLTFLWGTGLIVYVIAGLIIPDANTPEQKAAAYGAPATAQEFLRRAKQGYYEAMKGFPDRHARREWKRKFKRDMHDWGNAFQRDMSAQAENVRCRWQTQWASHPGAGLALPIVSLLHGAIVILWISALVSLLATGAVFGVALPAGVPVWIAVIVLMIAFGMLAWPLKAARKAFYYWSAPSAPFALFCLIDAVIWVAVVAALLWLAAHYLPHAREALHNIPTVVHDMVDTIKGWWNR
jgi:phage shock protein PspC (stress-responsive transcriptional regulator)